MLCDKEVFRKIRMPRLEHFKRLGAEEIPRYRKFYCYDDGETLILLALKDN